MKEESHTTPGMQLVPFSCRALLWIAQTYYGLINLMFIAMLILNKRMIKAVAPYFEKENINEKTLLAFIATATLILLSCNAGILLILLKKKAGLYFFLTGAIILLVIDSFFLQFDVIRYLLNTGFIFIVGFLHLTGRCYGKPTRVFRLKKALSEGK